ELTGVQNMLLLELRQGSGLAPTHSLGLPRTLVDRIRIPAGEGVVLQCIFSHRHRLVDITPDDPFFITGAKTYLIMPITARMAEGSPDAPSCIRPLGALWLDTTQPGPELTGQTISHLTGLAQQAGLRMESWRTQLELAAANTELKQANHKLNE